ncbi:MAG: hypothetical protein JST82_09830 [Bacteroidetes bacterium]|nr:hypothetical protein [Bacteroidota bacterium]
MKYILITAMLFTAAYTGTSCNKTWHCTCTDTTSNKVTYKNDIKSMSEHTARPQCEQYGSATINCLVTK